MICQSLRIDGKYYTVSIPQIPQVFYREKAPSNKTPALRKSKNMVVWAGGTLNQLFIRGL